MNLNLKRNAQDVGLNSMNNLKWFLSDLQSIPKIDCKVMTTFSCGGGSSMGYKLNGFEVVAANDIDPEMKAHYVKNLNPKHYFLCPIKELLGKELPKELFNLDILDGSPPCSTFSMAGKREKAWGVDKHFREGQAKQVLSDLFFDFINLAARLKPKVVIAENVKGMIVGNAKGYTKMILKRFNEIGYDCQIFLVNAADCGVPQKRERVFFCCVRNDLKKRKLKLSFNNKWITAKEACKDLQRLTLEEISQCKPGKFDLKCWKHTKKGRSYADFIKKTEGKNTGFGHMRLDGDKPAPTLIANGSLLTHWDQCRKLTFREYKRLGSFPDDYCAKSDKLGKYMVGMSVPPFMIKEVSKQIYNQWLT